MIRRGIVEIGELVLFASRVLRALFMGIPRAGLVDQFYQAGVHSVFTTVVTGIFVGAIMTMQIQMELRDFGAESFVGGLATSVTLRNVGPVLIAFILSGKVGAFTSAELGTMQVTDQIAALRCLGVDPFRSILAPRLLAVVLSSACLVVIGLVMTIFGGMLVGMVGLQIPPEQFLQNVSRIVEGWSIGLGLLKSLWYGFLIGLVACFYGYRTSGGSVGVGQSVQKAAVVTMVLIVLFDYLLSSISAAFAGMFV